MKRLKSWLAVAASLLVIFSPAYAAAQEVDPLQSACEQGAQSSSVCQDPDSSNPLLGPTGIITRAAQIITVIVGVASVIMIMIGGFRYIISSGDSSNVNSAKNTILYALIGLVIALLAQAIVLFVLRQL